MHRIKSLALMGAALTLVAGCSGTGTGSDATANDTAATAAASTGRVRGTVQAVTANALTVQTYDGKTVTVPIDAKTGYAWVVPSSLSSLKDGDFIGTATTGPKTALRAVEVVIFPESMRGTGEGHYAWDVPGVVAANGGDSAGSSAMTNGTVDAQSAMTNGTVEPQSAMTNGTVTGGAAPGAASSTNRVLSVSYKGGNVKVAVPAGVPIVRFDPTQKTVLAKGQKVFAVTPPGASAAKSVAIGKDGLTPPM
ncbi:conserved exported hypothetical protein [Sphingomonas aurantiaca]|uniref:Metal ABC transporter permease n=1 Tax=Sphingomonas aurantiaca TaxID=185949 RepID=A0A5E7Y8L1_9SPHN|nr:hypothetical protein [Sphingomonas aurantiaca]VVT02688.1 conserved exported hypothetical protein [Sphingomonas aurantiaca]